MWLHTGQCAPCHTQGRLLCLQKHTACRMTDTLWLCGLNSGPSLWAKTSAILNQLSQVYELTWTWTSNWLPIHVKVETPVKSCFIPERKKKFSKYLSTLKAWGFSFALFSYFLFKAYRTWKISHLTRSQCLQKTELLLCNTITVIISFRVTGRSQFIKYILQCTFCLKEKWLTWISAQKNLNYITQTVVSYEWPSTTNTNLISSLWYRKLLRVGIIWHKSS